jgi:hypothetical protein
MSIKFWSCGLWSLSRIFSVDPTSIMVFSILRDHTRMQPSYCSSTNLIIAFLAIWSGDMTIYIVLFTLTWLKSHMFLSATPLNLCLSHLYLVASDQHLLNTQADTMSSIQFQFLVFLAELCYLHIDNKSSYSFKYEKDHSIAGLFWFTAGFISTHFNYQVFSDKPPHEFSTESQNFKLLLCLYL